MKKNKDDVRYLNAPIELYKHFLNEPDDTYHSYTYKTCLDDILKYAVYAEVKKYHNLTTPEEKISKCSDYFNYYITSDYNKYFYEAKEIYYQYNNKSTNPVMVGISTDLHYDYSCYKKKEDEKIQLLGYLAIKSIVGNQTYKKSDMNFVLSRMDGKTHSVKKDLTKLSSSLIEYFGTENDAGKKIKPYRWTKLIKSLVNNWNLKYYSNYNRGFYVSYDMPLEDLCYHAEKKKKANLDKINKKKKEDVYKKAMERLGIAS